MTMPEDQAWIEANPGESSQAPIIIDEKPKRARTTKRDLEDRAAALNPDNPHVLARLDLAKELWGQFRTKSTILNALQAGIPQLQVPGLKSNAQAYTYYHRMMQDMQEDMTKSRTQKTAEHRTRLLALAKSAEKAGNHAVAAGCMDRIALIDQVANPITAPRMLNLSPDGAPPARAPKLADLNREQIVSLIQTGRLPEPKS